MLVFLLQIFELSNCLSSLCRQPAASGVCAYGTTPIIALSATVTPVAQRMKKPKIPPRTCAHLNKVTSVISAKCSSNSSNVLPLMCKVVQVFQQRFSFRSVYRILSFEFLAVLSLEEEDCNTKKVASKCEETISLGFLTTSVTNM